MNFFHIQPDDTNWSILYNDNIEATHVWNMPGIRCSLCGQTWAMIGIAYPLVDLSTLSSHHEFSEPWPVNVETYLKLRELVAHLVSDEWPIPPGTEFGPLVGKGSGKTGDFAWVNLWTLLIHHKAYLKLASQEIRLPKVSVPKLEFEETSSNELFEFQIEPFAKLSSLSYSPPEPKLCSLCGRDNRKVEQIIIEKRSIPSDVDMFRIKDFPTKILITERFMKVVEDLKLTNISFTSVTVD